MAKRKSMSKKELQKLKYRILAHLDELEDLEDDEKRSNKVIELFEAVISEQQRLKEIYEKTKEND